MRTGRVASVLLSIASMSACSSETPRAQLFGLEPSTGGYELAVTELADRGGQAINVSLSSDDGSAATVESDFVHLFMVDPLLDRIDHEVVPVADSGAFRIEPWLAIGDFGPSHVVAWFEDSSGEIVLGADVDIAEPSDFGSGFRAVTQGDLLISSGVRVERDGFDFALPIPWGGDPADTDPAWLTLVRRSDLALTFDRAELVEDRIFRFDPELPGPGEYIAVLEFFPAAFSDSEHQPLGTGGESRFVFFLDIGDDGRPIDTPESEFAAAVSVYSSAYFGGDFDAAWSTVSPRCRGIVDRAEFLDLAMVSAREHSEGVAMSIDVDIAGVVASATYEVALGEYVPGSQPRVEAVRDEQWVDDGDGWRWDDC